MKDDLGTRMKEQYELRFRQLLPRRTYTIIRLDGKAFHSYCRGLEKPFDYGLVEDMGSTMTHLCKVISGVQFAFQQSDEISLLLTDFATNQTQAWFDGNVQKITSISASICTDHFNTRRELRDPVGCKTKRGYFDSRAFVIPDPVEVANYFVWRQKDATRNSISMAAQAHFSHAQLHKMSTKDMQEMLWFYKDINWNDYPVSVKRGQLCVKVQTDKDVTYTDKRGEEITVEGVKRSEWQLVEAPIFTQSEWLRDHIPLVGADG